MLTSGFPGGSDSKEPACDTGELDSIPGSGRSLQKEMASHSSISHSGKSHGQRSLVATAHGVAKSQI